MQKIIVRKKKKKTVIHYDLNRKQGLLTLTAEADSSKLERNA
jgi:hypothetical protein